ncbi:unnamed protein product, partial [Ectocarpus sp. 8 AP-2014]
GVIADTSRLTPTGLSTGETRSVDGEDNRMSPPPPPPPESSTRGIAGSGAPGSAASAESFHSNFAGDPIRTAEVGGAVPEGSVAALTAVAIAAAAAAAAVEAAAKNPERWLGSGGSDGGGSSGNSNIGSGIAARTRAVGSRA